MAFNLGYGLIGILFALLMQQMRSVTAGAQPDWSSTIIEKESFMLSIGWFPWYTVLLFSVLLLISRQRLREKR
jgi:hypothetical protein